MKKTNKYSTSNSKNKTSKTKLLVIAVLSVVLVGTLISSMTKPVDINLIGSQSTVNLEGVLIKDTPAGVKGSYYLLNLSGNAILLSTSDNLDSFEGKQVNVTGMLSAESATSPQSLILTKLEVLSTQ